jgi:hypothetical protein
LRTPEGAVKTSEKTCEYTPIERLAYLSAYLAMFSTRPTAAR